MEVPLPAATAATDVDDRVAKVELGHGTFKLLLLLLYAALELLIAPPEDALPARTVMVETIVEVVSKVVVRVRPAVV